MSSNEKSLVGSEWREWWGRMTFDGSGERGRVQTVEPGTPHDIEFGFYPSESHGRLITMAG